MRAVAPLICAMLLTACGEAQKLELGPLSIPVAAGDLLHSCPSEDLNRAEDASITCVLGKKDDAVPPYTTALSAAGWAEAGPAWKSADGKTCVSISTYPTTFNMRDRTLIEFRQLDACPA